MSLRIAAPSIGSRLVWSQTMATVTARHVVMATHLPLGQIGGYYAQAHP